MTAQPDTAELRFGFTLADIENMARRAARHSRWQFVKFPEKYDLAWSAIAEELYACDEQPDEISLVRAGERAVTRHVEQLGHMWGQYYYRPDSSGMPRFDTYWHSLAALAQSPEPAIVDSLALAQIWERMNPTYRKVLLALAEHGDYESAAESLGKTYRTFVTQISLARTQFLRLWHEGESPSRVWGRDRRKRRDPDRERYHAVTVATIRRRRRRAEAGH